jgi:LacI family transcriptional regulator
MGKRQKVTMKALADQLGLSVSVVSRVLSGQASKYRISKKTEDAILKASEKLDFSANRLARGLRLSKTSTFGFVIPDISNPFFSDIARHIAMEARKLGYSIILCDSEENTEIEKRSLKLLQSWMVDGLIISPVGRTGDHLAELHRDGFPMVVIDRRFSEVDLPYVTSDNFTGAYEGTRHLLEHGHRSIGFVQGIPDSGSNVDRVRGYKAALKEYGVSFKKSLVVGDDFGEKSGYTAAKLLLKRKVRPTAVFLASNLIALGAVRAFAEQGIDIPNDVSVVAFDDEPHSPHLATPMTTIAQQTAEMGRIAVKLLFEQIEGEGKAPPEGILLPTKLIPRESVREVRGE